MAELFFELSECPWYSCIAYTQLFPKLKPVGHWQPKKKLCFCGFSHYISTCIFSYYYYLFQKKVQFVFAISDEVDMLHIDPQAKRSSTKLPMDYSSPN